MQNKNRWIRVLFAMTLVAALYLLPDELLVCVRRIFEAMAIAHLVIDFPRKN
jgi:hypothetical protein